MRALLSDILSLVICLASMGLGYGIRWIFEPIQIPLYDAIPSKRPYARVGLFIGAIVAGAIIWAFTELR